MENLIKYINSKIRYYSGFRGDDYFNGMRDAYADILDVVEQIMRYENAKRSSGDNSVPMQDM